jgi:hypothetical protein
VIGAVGVERAAVVQRHHGNAPVGGGKARLADMCASIRAVSVVATGGVAVAASETAINRTDTNLLCMDRENGFIDTVSPIGCRIGRRYRFC